MYADAAMSVVSVERGIKDNCHVGNQLAEYVVQAAQSKALAREGACYGGQNPSENITQKTTTLLLCSWC